MKNVTKNFRMNETVAEMLADIAKQADTTETEIISKLIGEAYNWTGLKNDARKKRIAMLKSSCDRVTEAFDHPGHQDFFKAQYFGHIYAEEYNRALFFNQKP